ncbi:hypothetical protein [Thalassovita taeanensis]|uniref:Uncharacterized protein n=1 Tax=Thalassovita taeanensis TaxID=657014 RepID=A0A1H9AUF7_9RHOB|nr:hypothetical protein [Thalassovita taeanensis]SEP80043.1 hypothetical protein SAMN04488092_102259 [Thalassovita taeanensis]
MTQPLWSQSLAEVYARHPLHLFSGAATPVTLILLSLGWAFGPQVGLNPLWITLILAAFLGLRYAMIWFLERPRVRFTLTPTGPVRVQGDIEQPLPFGDSANFTLTRGPLRRALNLPALLTLSGQNGIMRSWTVVWPVVADRMDTLRTALDQALEGKRP